MSHFDYIILGAGASGLMLARAMAEDPWFESKSVLIIDKEIKNKNDRTWCYWEKSDGPFDELLIRKWKNIYFNSDKQELRLSIAPYTYKMIRALDFYNQQFEVINQAGHMHFLKATVESVSEENDKVKISTSEGNYQASFVFNSLFDIESLRDQSKFPVLKQHFIGWYVKTDRAVFDEKTATFMDFSVPQKGNTRFMYLLPVSPTESLVEYTLFSEDLLPDHEYEEAIEDYLKHRFEGHDFEIIEKEKGQIPMTSFDFEAANTNRVLRIGTAGGWAKASTGFTFRNTIRNTRKLIRHLKNNTPFEKISFKNRFRYYDILLLDILHRNNALGSKIFASMFNNRKPELILKFLDEETNLLQDLWLISGCPYLPFTKALLRRIFGRR